MPDPTSGSNNAIAEDPNRSLRRRAAFSKVLGVIPGFLESLRQCVLERSDFLMAVARGEQPDQDSRQQAERYFQEWVLGWGIVDEWFQEAARRTVEAWAVARVRTAGDELEKHYRHFWYSPAEDALKPAMEEFQLQLNEPYPLPRRPLRSEERQMLARSPIAERVYDLGVERESAEEFRSRMQKQFTAQLGDFIARYEAKMTETRNTKRDAEWTALFQSGMSPKAIEKWEWERSGNSFSHARIQQAIRLFADAIGLTLRRPKRGRHATVRKVSSDRERAEI